MGDRIRFPVCRKSILLFFVFILTATSLNSQWLNGYLYRKTITIPAAQVSGGPHTNFPVLISVTDLDLRTTGNGGYVENINGWDIVFSQDHSTILYHEIENYDPVTGNFIAWVNIPNLPAGGLTFYIYFGNSSVSVDPSTTSTWSADFNGVWHLDGLNDATINGNTATDNGTSGTSTAKIYRARRIYGGGEYFGITQTTIPNGNFTISLWFRASDVTDGTLFDLSNSGTGKYFFSSLNTTSLRWYFESANDNDAQTTYNTTLTNFTWYYLTVIGRYNSNYHELYLNGNFVGSSNVSLDGKPVLNNIRVGADWGYYPVLTHGPFNGRIDEFRIANTDRSAEWILTEFRNQDDPGSFMSFGGREYGVPQVFNVTGSGSYCAGGGRTVQLSGSEIGVNYQLKKNGDDEGSPLAGTGGILNWNGMTEGVYTIVATRTATGLSATMNGSAAITENPSPAAALGYKYQKTITIDHNQVSGGSDLYDFPVLISITSSPDRDALRTVINGGHVEDSNGWDIIFTDDEYNRLEHQVESYTATNGNLIAWVRVPVLSASTNTVIRILYGNPQVVADPSTSSTWGAVYTGVWHLDDLNDGTSNGNDGTNNGSSPVSGFIGNGRSFNGTSRIDVPRDATLEPASSITVSFWMRRNGAQNTWAKPLWYGRNDVSPWGPYGFEFNNSDDNEINFHVTNGSVTRNGLSGNIISDNTWYLVTGTYDGTNVNLYINNSFIDSDPLTGDIGQYGSYGLAIGDKAESGQGFTGIIDEVRIETTARSQDWIFTEYNNQSSPGTFFSVGSEANCSEYTFSDLCSGSPIPYSVPNTVGHSYSWTVNGGTPSSTTGNSITVTWDATGPYNIQLQETSSCTGNSPVYTVSVSAQPVAQAITKNPDLADVCVNASVSATFSGGSGGVNPVNEYESSVDGGGSWQVYTPGNPLSSAVAAPNRIQARTRRTTSGTGCNDSGWNTVTWNTVPQPVGPTLNTKTPNQAAVCDGQLVSATFNPGSGGSGCTDSYQYRFDGAGGWSAYTPGTDLNTTGHTLVEIQGQRSGCSAGAGCTGTTWVTLADWTVNPLPTITLDAVSPICNTQSNFNLPYSGATNNPITYSIIAGTPAMPGFTPVTDAALPASPINITVPAGVAENNYEFIITVKNGNGCVSTPQSFIVDDYENQIADAGSDQFLCGSLSSVFDGNTPTHGSGTWTYVSGPDATPTFGNENNPTSSIDVDLYGTYVFRWTLGNGPCLTQDDVTIDFNEDPTGLDAGANQDLCGVLTTALTGTAHPYQGGSDHAGSTGVWTQISGIGTITFTDDTSPTTNITADLYGSYVLRWTETNGTCTVSDDVTIDFNEDPTGLDAGADQALCGILTTALMGTAHPYQAGSEHAGSTKTWSYVSGPDTSPVFSNINSPTSNVTVTLYGTYVFRWTETNGTCTRSDDVTIAFNEAAYAGEDQNICGVLNSVLEGNTPSAGSGGWTITSQPVGSTVIFGDPSNPSSTIGVDLYGVYILRWTLDNPVAAGCNTFDEVTLWFDPTPVVTAVSDTLCNNDFTAISPQTTTTNSRFGIRYTWTAEDIDNIIIGESSSTGNGLRIEKQIIQQLNNPDNLVHRVIYHITPWTIMADSSLHCPGATIDIDIWVEPTVNITAPNDTICDNTPTNIVVNSINTTMNGIRYTWTVVDNPDVTGETGSVGQGQLIATPIVQTLDNTSPDAQLVQYTITPWTIDNNGNNRCPGVPVTVDIWVEPTVSITAPNDTICDNTPTNIVVNSINTTTNGIRYTWTVVDNPDVTGESGSTGQGQLIGTAIVQTLVNTSNSSQRVTYTITPWTIDNNGNNKCPGDQLIAYAWVEPTARVTATISNDTICNNTVITYTLASPTSSLYGVRFNVNVINPYPEISGYSDRINLTTASIINENLNNSGDTARMIMYVVRPATLDAHGAQRCIGINDTIRLWINPTPRVIPINSLPEICYGGTTDITLTTPTVMTKGIILFDYTVSVTGGPGIVVGNMSPGSNLVPGQQITWSYQNNSDTIQSVFFSITPKVSGFGCAPGNINTPEVKIHALPLQGIDITKPLTCDGGSDATLRANLSKGASPYQIIWDGPFNYHSEGSAIISNLQGGRYDVRIIDNLGCTNADFIYVEGAFIDSYFDVTSDVSCPGDSDGSLRIRVNNTSTGTPPFEYWVVYNYQDTVIYNTLPGPGIFNYHNGLIAGNYKLFMRDANGCYDNNFPEVNIVEPEVMSVTFDTSQYEGGYNISCKGYNDGSAWINTISGGNGGYTYNWYTIDGYIPGPTNTDRIDSITAGTYYLEIRDSKNCYKLDSVTLTEPEGIELAGYQLSSSPDGNFNISCNGSNDGYIQLNVTGGSGTYDYSWTGPGGFTASTPDISNLIAGTYTATVIDVSNTSCILAPQPIFTLTEPALLNIGVTTSSSLEGSHEINCFGGTGSIDLTVTGGSTGNYKYDWSTTDGSGIVEGQEDQNTLTAGTYHVVVSDSNYCVASTDITLTQPTQLITTLVPTHITCQSAGFDNGSIDLTVTGGVPPYSYLWSNGAMTQDINNLTEGNYTVTVTDANSCQIIDSVRVNLPPPLSYNSTISDYNGFNVSCFGMDNPDGYIQITPTDGEAPFVYSWQGPDGFTSSEQNISNLKPGQYQLLITDKNSCTATGIFDLTDPGKLGMDITLSESFDGNFNIDCAGTRTGFINVEPVNQAGTVNYLWSDGATGNLRTDIPAGTYQLIMTDQNNCHADTTLILTEPDSIKITFDVTQAFCPDSPDGEIQISVTGGISGAGYSYKWSDGSTGQNISNILRGLYWVAVTDNNNCTVKDSVFMEPQNETCLIIPNAISPNDDNINDVWNIGMTYLYPQMDVKIFNRWEELVWQSERGYPHPWDGRSKGFLLPIDSYHYVINLHNGSRLLVGTITIVR